MMNPDEISWLSKVFRKIDIFSSLSMADVGDLIDHMQKRHYASGVKIVKQGDPGDAFFIIYKGSVSVKKGLMVFKRKVGTLGPAQFFGEMSLLSDEPRIATVTANEETDCFLLLKGHFEHLLKKNPSFAGMMKELSEKRK